MRAMWWGYLHENGTIQVKRWFGDNADYTKDCQNNSFVKIVISPFVAESREKAIQIVIEKLGLEKK